MVYGEEKRSKYLDRIDTGWPGKGFFTGGMAILLIRQKKLKAWPEGKRERTAVSFIPPYGPGLNPQAYLIQDAEADMTCK